MDGLGNTSGKELGLWGMFIVINLKMPDEIEKDLFDRYDEVEYKTVNYRTGRHQRGWVKNVVGSGIVLRIY